MLFSAFVVAQLVATFIGVYANWGFTQIHGFGWNWAGIVWIWNIVWFIPLYFMDMLVVYVQTHYRYWVKKIHERHVNERHGLKGGHLFNFAYLQSITHHHHPRHNRHGRKEVSEFTSRARARAGLTATENDRKRSQLEAADTVRRTDSTASTVSKQSGLSRTGTGRLHGLSTPRTPNNVSRFDFNRSSSSVVIPTDNAAKPNPEHMIVTIV